MNTINHPLSQKPLPYVVPLGYGHERCSPIHAPGPCVKNSWLIHYVVSGTGTFSVKGKVYRPQAGECFVIRPNELVMYQADEQDPWHYIWLSFQCFIEPPAALQEDILRLPGLASLFLSLPSLDPQQEGIEAHIYGKIFELFALLWGDTAVCRESESPCIVRQTVEYMRKHLWEKMTVGALAERVHLSTSHFSEIFRKETGMTPLQYLTNERMGFAAFTLLTEERPVREVAALIGYEEASTFSRSFKRQFGLSPQAFVREYKERNSN